MRPSDEARISRPHTSEARVREMYALSLGSSAPRTANDRAIAGAVAARNVCTRSAYRPAMPEKYHSRREYGRDDPRGSAEAQGENAPAVTDTSDDESALRAVRRRERVPERGASR